METTRDRGPGVASPDLHQDQLAAQAHRLAHHDTPTRWVRLFDTCTYSDVVVNVAYVVRRIVEVAGTDFVHVVLVDGSAVEIAAHRGDHDRLLEAIGGLEVPA